MSYVITIDGPAGAGKSSVSRKLADVLKIKYLDTGAIYRAIALILNEAEILPEENILLNDALEKIKIELRGKKVLVNDFDVSGEIRTPKVDKLSSVYSALPSVRRALLGLQQEQKNYGPLIAEGRDVGSVVFPNADLKIYLTASPEARAKRRFIQRNQDNNNNESEFLKILEDIKKRDEYDSHREFSPLTIPKGAIIIDTSDLTEQEVINNILELVNQKGLQKLETE